MAGLFESLGIDKDAIEEATGFSSIPDGTHPFEITEAEIRNGTTNKPDTTFYVIDYDLEEHGHKLEFFTVAEDGEFTDAAEKSLGYLKRRLRDLGVDWDAFDPEETSLEGIRGFIKLVTTKSKKDGKEYQNIRDVTVEEIDDDSEPSDYDDGSAAQDAAIKAKVQAKRAERASSAPAKPTRTRAAKPATVTGSQDNPFEQG